MDSSAQVNLLLSSDRWNEFLKSTALGLQLNLTLVFPGADHHIQVPGECPVCHETYPSLTSSDIAAALKNTNNYLGEFTSDSGLAAVVMPLRDGLLVIARECACTMGSCGQPLPDRTIIAHKLLVSFQAALGECFVGGKRAVELSTLRHMNQIVLSLFQGEGDALQRSFDLVLSALVILLDARASWLECRGEGGTSLQVKGDRPAVESYLKDDQGPAVSFDINTGSTRGRLGVFAPADQEQAKALLPQMAQECVIVFEVARLFKLLHSRLAQVLGSIGSAVVLVDRYGCVTYANKAAEQLLGRPALTLIGKPHADIPAPWTRFIKSDMGGQVTGRMDPVGQGTEMRWVDWQLSPLGEDGTALGWLILAEDRTDFTRWQNAAREAERLYTTTTMVGKLAHELRNPLSAASGLLQLVGRKREPDKVKGYVDLIMRELERVTRLLNEFLLLGRPADMAPEPLDLAAFLHELTPLLEGEAAGTGVKIIIDMEETPPVAADPGQLTQVVLNLTRNAVEAAPGDGLVEIALRANQDGAALSFCDSGPGLTSGVMEKLFRPFFTTKERGTGLGLPVVQAIVHNHGGRVTATNAPGGGALFTVILPVCAETGSGSAKIDVLIAVADKMVCYPAEQALRASGYNVLSADGTADALLLADRYEPAMLLLDQYGLDENDLVNIQKAWPLVYILIIGEPRKQGDTACLNFIPRPLDAAGLVGKVDLVLGPGICRN